MPYSYVGWGKTTQLGTGMGIAQGAKLARPDATVVNFMGDASIGMVGMELETAARCELGTLTLVLKNSVMGGYSDYHPVASEKYRIEALSGDYADLAKALGAYGERVEKAAEVKPAIRAGARPRGGGQGRPSSSSSLRRKGAYRATFPRACRVGSGYRPSRRPLRKGRAPGRVRLVEEAAQLIRSARVAELSQRLRLDLADAFARHVELLADFLERVIGIHLDAEAHAQHFRLARRQAGENVLGGFAQALRRSRNRRERRCSRPR